jgi:mannose-6-phosphate isomerase-like protein (cupin superfamily)
MDIIRLAEKIFDPLAIIGYADNAIVTKQLIKKDTGSIALISYDSGVALNGNINAFNTFLQILQGSIIITISGKQHNISSGQCIIVPAHATYNITAVQQCKMLSVLIKSGYQ